MKKRNLYAALAATTLIFAGCGQQTASTEVTTTPAATSTETAAETTTEAPKARIALLREGFDGAYIDAHKPSFKWGDRHLFDEADLIVGMSRANKWVLPLRYHRKFVTISEYAEGAYEKVPDPFLMKEVDDYLAVMDFLKAKLVKFADKIKSLPADGE